MSSFGDRIGKWGAGIATAGAAGLAAIAAGAAVLGPALLRGTGQLQSLQNKVQTVFGDQLPVVQAWADSVNERMGLSARSVEGLAAGFADLLIPMGFTRAQATGMSTDVIGLSSALAQWSGGQRTSTEVAEILSSAMLGERDALKGLGISITEAEVTGRLLQKGQQDLTGTALQQAEAIATQELIFEKSTDAQAAYAAGANPAIDAQNRFKAALLDLKDRALVALEPYTTALTTWAAERLPGAIATAEAWIRDTLIPKLGEIRGWWDANGQTIIDAAAAFAAGVINMAADVKRVIDNDALPALRRMRSWWDDNGPAIESAMGSMGAALTNTAVTVNDAGQGVNSAFAGMREDADFTRRFFGLMWDDFMRRTEGARTFVSAAVVTMGEQIAGAVFAMGAAVEAGVTRMVDWFKGLPGRATAALAQLGGQLASQAFGAMGEMAAGFLRFDLWGAVKGIFTNLLAQVKGFFGISSPSKVFADLGANIARGLAQGITSNTGMVAQAAQHLYDASGAKASVERQQASMGSGGRSRSGLGASSSGLNPEFLARFQRYSSAVLDRFGMVLKITSGWRSNAQQAALYAQKPNLAAPPGRSNHERGLAIDHAPHSNQYMRSTLAGQFGLRYPMQGFGGGKNEPWHIEPLAGGAFVRAGQPILGIVGEGRSSEVVAPLPMLEQLDAEQNAALLGGWSQVTQAQTAAIVAAVHAAANFITHNIVAGLRQQTAATRGLTAADFTRELGPEHIDAGLRGISERRLKELGLLDSSQAQVWSTLRAAG